MQQILQSYLRRLTNLSSNNRSLLLLKSGTEQFIDVHDFDYAANEPSFSIIEGVIGQKSKIPLCPVIDSRDGDANVLSQRLKKLLRLEKFIFEERGGKDLYIGWPFVRGKFNNDHVVRCPLMFFPVNLEISGNSWSLAIRNTVNVTLNKSFLLAYAHFNEVKVNEELLERVFDDFDKDSRIYRTSLYELFKESNIELNFNQENFIDKLARFEHFKKTDLENICEKGELKLYPEAVLGIFPQAGSYLVPDYLHLIKNNPVGSLEEFFLKKTTEEDKEEIDFTKHSESFHFLNRVKEEQTVTPFEMDAFQENAIKAVKSGNSIVVQGPPGTGKSQMICNLISDYIARGLNVLLVCQKRAALDVVYSRLKKKDIVDFVGLVHDFKNDRKEIYEQVANQIERLSEYRQKNNSLDAIQLERRFLQVSRTIDQITEELEEYKSALFNELECGKSVKELYLTSDLTLPSINIKQEYKDFKFDSKFDDFLRKLKFLSAYATKFEKENYPWHSRKNFAEYGISDLKKIQKYVLRIPRIRSEVASSTLKIVGNEIDIEDETTIYNNKESIIEMLSLLKDDNVFEHFKHMVSYPNKDTDSLWLSNTERTLMDCYKGVGPETSQDIKELGRLQEALHKSMQTRKNIFKWIRWRLFSKEKILISRVLVANGLQSDKKGFKILVEKVDNRLNLEHNTTKLKSKKWLKSFPSTLLKIDLQNWFYYQRRALNAKLIFNSLRSLERYFNLQKTSSNEFQEQVHALLEVMRIVYEEKSQWSDYLTDKQINQIAVDEQFAKDTAKSLTKDFDSLVDNDSIQSSLKEFEKAVFIKLKEEVGEIKEESLEKVFQNSLRLAWIDHIETKYPILTSVSALKFEKFEAELQESVAEKLQISNDILLLKTRERTYHDLEFNRLNNLVSYRELNHQVTKKRRIWPVRKLINHFHDEVFDLIPCWMVSPEAASAIFPMNEVFNLVIFDEASQCFAERGLPAMYRGKQIVITGDDKQLKPNDLYRVKWKDENEDDLPELDVDSLLNLAKQHLMQVQLKGHYRSKSLDLINFSNNHFYDNKLRLLPDFNDINVRESSIKYLKVDGIWERGTNLVEAHTIANIVFDILKNEPEKGIGVITFNSFQQSLIMDIVEEYAIDKGILIPESLFIKNIENVQGDEKDIIIFSIGYAPDGKNKMNMQFGSLNVEGGENRLNVAITRARDKIFVVSSIHPAQLKVDESKNQGPKLFKKYLEYALAISEGSKISNPEKLRIFHIDWYLKSLLKSWEIPELSVFELNEDLPFADLTVKKSGEYKGLIMTDDDLYFEGVSAKQAHAFRPFIMAKKDWPYTNLHSREFWLDKESSRDKLLKFLNRGAGVEAIEK